MEASLPSMLGKHTVLHSPGHKLDEWKHLQLEQSCPSVCHIGCIQDVCVTNRNTRNSHAAAQIHLKLHVVTLSPQCRRWHNTLNNQENQLNIDFYLAFKQLCSAFLGGITVKCYFCFEAVVLYYWPVYPGVSVYFLKYQEEGDGEKGRKLFLLKLCVLLKAMEHDPQV